MKPIRGGLLSAIGAAVLLLVIVSVVLVVATGGGGRGSGTGDARVAAAHAANNPLCPYALRPGPHAYQRVAGALRREVPRVFPNSHADHFSHRGYSVWAELSLAERGRGEVGFPRARLTRKAAAACGRGLALRSWVAVIDFPRAPSATLGTYVTYLARTKDHGWRFWYAWLPYASRHGFFLSR